PSTACLSRSRRRPSPCPWSLAPCPSRAASGHPCVSPPSEQVAQRPEMHVQLRVREPEDVLELGHPLLEQHERLAEAVDLLLGERAVVDPAQRLSLHQLAQEFDQRQNELGEALLQPFRI